ncbi:hypothetical protein LSH36_189g03059 [Paralvinella palmiformis]|uniref:DOCKER domain-containing protein n=1 Tax=Paralvinella palmiformis TaxID=53620 RepID=A0AAD9JRC3_9ANNE|nr:hypothetical protein LSH36_189g03059 [Paralvinella palmiformis]
MCFIWRLVLVREFPQGCSAFRKISSNVETEEAGMKDDDGMQDFDYTEDKLTSLLDECASLFEMAERYEVLGDIYRLIIPIYERKRDFEIYFEEEDGKEYVYKEPKVTSLTEICDRLKKLFSDKYGAENVKLIMNSNKKRVQVVYHNEYNISPIEVAIDEMTAKVRELRDVIGLESPDFKKLQLKLAGSVSAQVNAGPLAYAETFLEETNVHRYDPVKINKLKDTFSDQLEYHDSLLHYYHEMTERLSEIFGEQLTLEDDRISLASHRSSMTVFSVISSSGQSSQI